MTTEDPIKSTGGEKAGEALSLALSAVPYVGGPLAELAKAAVTRRQTRRLNEFLRRLADDLEQVKARLDSTLGESESFQDFAEAVFEEAESATQQEKLDALRSVFLNTILSDPPNYDRGLEILGLIKRLQPRHLVMLRILADPRQADREAGNVVGEGGGFTTSINQILRKLLPSWGEDEIERTWTELQREHLISGGVLKGMITDTGIHQLHGRIAPFGSAVVNHLINPVAHRPGS